MKSDNDLLSDLFVDVLKADAPKSGPGSRGGVIIGTYPNGKPIYQRKGPAAAAASVGTTRSSGKSIPSASHQAYSSGEDLTGHPDFAGYNVDDHIQAQTEHRFRGNSTAAAAHGAAAEKMSAGVSRELSAGELDARGAEHYNSREEHDASYSGPKGTAKEGHTLDSGHSAYGFHSSPREAARSAVMGAGRYSYPELNKFKDFTPEDHEQAAQKFTTSAASAIGGARDYDQNAANFHTEAAKYMRERASRKR